ncbi:MAG: quinate 5-dehydrogenase [Chloroflexota bacterium]|nr:quinate 5-dehydrogenase [Chloroflexota bacterium]MBI5704395.1 quinate 5-dehydrogenase [Chloroflexota bacterium]
MKRAVSISIGSSKRNKAVTVELLGEKVSIERIGTDGDMEAAALKYKELDGTVDAFGVGGADLGALIDGKFYPFHSVQPMVRFVKKTPLVDGGGLKNTLENRAPAFLDKTIGDYIRQRGRKVFVTLGVDRWGLSKSFVEAGYEVIFGDLMFALGVPIPIRTMNGLRTLAKIMIPIVTRFPFEWLYPTGEKQEERIPKYEKYYHWATVIAGDCHYIKRHMPEDMQGKVIVTNTTTPEDVELFRKCGVKYLVTTTPVLDGRSFGTNMMEAALVAASGKGRPLTWAEYDELLDKLGFEPQLQELNS